MGGAFRLRGGIAIAARHALLAGILLILASASTEARGAEKRILLTGDILLSRNVSVEIESRKTSPWADLSPLLKSADFAFGNLEGAVGLPEFCNDRSDNLCFAVSPERIELLTEAGFDGVGVENNHSSDLGPSGRAATVKTVGANGMAAVAFEDSPIFFSLGDLTLSMVVVNMVAGREIKPTPITSPELTQKMRLARALSDLVIVSVHWGKELQDWPTATQKEAAVWLISHGADIVAGHHPHVVQQPACVDGKPVYFSLGNHVFDQKYPATKIGQIADCRIDGGILSCTALATKVKDGTFFPSAETIDSGGTNALAACNSTLKKPINLNGYELHGVSASGGTIIEGRKVDTVEWRSLPVNLLSVQAGSLWGENGSEQLFTLERHFSPIDGEASPRPYVYEATEKGLNAKWRGSALAWPLVDAVLLKDGSLCALHRGDSFMELIPKTETRRTLAYRWNGFGFSGIGDTEACSSTYGNITKFNR